MPRRRVPTHRFDLESLEHRLTPSTSSWLPPGLLISQSADMRAHPFAPSSKALDNKAVDTATPTTQTLSLQGLA